MKKSILAFATIAMISCGAEKKDVKNMTYEERVVDMCECFELAEDKDDCYLIQADHISYLNDDQVTEFIKESNECPH